MTLDEIIAAEHAATRAIGAAQSLVTDRATLAGLQDALQILGECRHFAVCINDALELPTHADRLDLRNEARARLARFLSPHANNI